MTLRHSSFKPKAPQRDRAAERAATNRALMASTAKPRPGVRMSGTAPAEQGARLVAAGPVLQKTLGRVKQAIRDSARGEDCRIRLVGCPCDPAMTIWSHCRHGYAGKGGAIKAIDLLGCYGCTYCDAIYDGQRPRPAGTTAQDVELAWFRAHAESLVILKQKGLA